MEIKLNSENFKKEVLESKIPVLVDFWAPWCPPCRMVGPIVDKLARDYQGKIKVGKVNVDQEPQLAQKYQVLSIPSFKIFKNGKIFSEFSGGQPEEKFVEEIEKCLT